MVRCGACGYGLTAASAHTRGKEYRYYRCITRDKRGKDACPTKPLPAAELERAVVDRVRGIAGDRTLLDAIARRARERVQGEGVRLRREEAELPGVIAKLATDAHRLADALASAKPGGREHIANRLDDVGLQLRAHEARLASLKAELAAHGDVVLDVAWTARTLGQFDRVWEAMTRPNRARLVRAIVEKVVVDQRGGKLAVHLRDGAATMARVAA